MSIYFIFGEMMKVLHEVKDFFVGIGKDTTKVSTKKLNIDVRDELISSIALRIIGVIGVTLAATMLISGLAVAATPLTAVSVILTSISILVIAHDILTVGINKAALAKDVHNIGKGPLHWKGYTGLGSLFSKAFKEELTGIPDSIKGTLLLAPLWKAFTHKK